jgi:hypothetical protein
LREAAAHGAQFAQQTHQPFAPYRDLLGLAAAAFGQHVEFTLVPVKLHLHRIAHLLPRQVEPFLFVLVDSPLGRAHQIERLPLRFTHFFQNRFRRNTPIHNPHPPRFAVRGFDLLQKVAQRRAVRRVPIHHFVSQRETVGRDHQRDDQLHAVRPSVTTVPAFGFGILFHLPFEVRARQVIEQNFEIGGEQVRPPLLQKDE